MKYWIIALIVVGFLRSGYAQLTPGPRWVEPQWIKAETSTMDWFMQRDTARVLLGRVQTQILANPTRLTVVTTVAMRGSNAPWVDSSSCERATGRPLRHTSANVQRAMVLDFGPIVTGFYDDKRSGQRTTIRDTTKTPYFDSNLHPVIVRWLPLREGYQQDIAIYDYNPTVKTGVLLVSVKSVRSGQYTTKTDGSRAVWLVEVSDQISGGTSVYSIDKATRKLWQQDIAVGGRTMRMVALD